MLNSEMGMLKICRVIPARIPLILLAALGLIIRAWGHGFRVPGSLATQDPLGSSLVVITGVGPQRFMS